MNRKKKAAAIIVLIISVLPWLFALGYGIYYAIVGMHHGIDTITVEYGIKAFFNAFMVLVFFYWWIFLISIILILICICELKYLKISENNDE